MELHLTKTQLQSRVWAAFYTNAAPPACLSCVFAKRSSISALKPVQSRYDIDSLKKKLYEFWWTFFFLVPRRFMVYWIPIRVYRNHADKGVRFPRWQPMRLKVSLLMPVFGKEMQDFVGQIALPIGWTRKGLVA